MILNFPIILTWLRIAAIPLFVAVLYLDEAWLTTHQANIVATVIFVAAAITDWLDGYLARRWNQTSAFGAFLDPVADKLMVAAALIVLVEFGRVDAIVALIIIGREITISALREWMAQLGQSKSVAVSMLGKVKTVSQLVAIPFLLYDGVLFGVINCRVAGRWMLWLAAAPHDLAAQPAGDGSNHDPRNDSHDDPSFRLLLPTIRLAPTPPPSR